MNNFNNVFLSLKQYFIETGITSEVELSVLEGIIPIKSRLFTLTQYIEILDSVGFVVYSRQRKTVAITQKGLFAEHMFTIDPN